MDILDTLPQSGIVLDIPVHNEGRFVEQSVNSIEQYIISSKLEEKFKFTIIIAEDGSTDNSYGIIEHLCFVA
jgi:glycosyltransferase involved in cell wall biosynthesis